MTLVCSHCDRYDAVPLSAVPSGWSDVQPGLGALPCSLYAVELDAGASATHFGTCPECAVWLKSANVVPTVTREAAGMLF